MPKCLIIYLYFLHSYSNLATGYERFQINYLIMGNKICPIKPIWIYSSMLNSAVYHRKLILDYQMYFDISLAEEKKIKITELNHFLEGNESSMWSMCCLLL